MTAKPHPEQGFRACLGILRLARSYGSAPNEAACRRGNDIGATTYRSIKSILQHGLDRAYANKKPSAARPIQHRNIPERRHDAHASHPRPPVALGLTGMAKALEDPGCRLNSGQPELRACLMST